MIEFEVEWIVDSSASYHYDPKKEYFTAYKAESLRSINIGNKSTSQIVGISNICVQTEVSYTITLKNVRHVPNLCLNLHSTSTLDKEGYEHFIGKGTWKLIKGSFVVVKGKMCCLLYKTHLKICESQLNIVKNDASPNS